MRNKFFKYLLILVIGLVIVFLIVFGLSFRNKNKTKDTGKVEPINLVYWRVKEDSSSFSDLIKGFEKIYPYITITYKQIRPEIYEQTLWQAWAKDEGPDIFSIPSTWLGKYQDMISPCPLGAQLKMKKTIIVGKIRKKPQTITKIEKVYNLVDLKKTFIDLVPDDVVINKNIYGLPLSMDVLVLYYNKDMLNNASIANPPLTWQGFTDDVKHLTLQDKEGNFIQSGASLGGAENTRYATDILSLLMLQNGTTMIKNNQAKFDKLLAEDKTYFPGTEALRFYTDFANPSKEIYTWNKNMPDSLEAFINSKTAFFIGYYSDLSKIKKQAPKLNFDIAPVPQITGSLKKINFANYWVEAVSKKTKHPNASWVFLNYISQTKNAKTFIEKTNYPTAHRDLISQQLQDINLAPFAQEVLTAKTWYKGKDYSLVKKYFEDMIKDVLSGQKTPQESINWCAKRVSLTL